MHSLESHLTQILEHQKRLAEEIRLAKAELDRVSEENDNLFAATAHIGAAMHAAIEERDSHAGAPLSVPALGIEEPQQQIAQEQPQQPLGGPILVPVEMPGGPSFVLTPGSAALAALFSPNCGDDLFAACSMFVSPADRLAQMQNTAQRRAGNLFQDDAAAAPSAAGMSMGVPLQHQAAPRPAVSEEKSFSFRL